MVSTELWRITSENGLHPDIAVFAKALGNGHPIGAIIGVPVFMDAAKYSFISSTYD